MKPEFIKIIFGVFNAATHRKLVTVFSLFGFHVILICWLLNEISLWDVDQFFPTLFLYIFSGLSALIGAKDANSDREYFSRMFRSDFKATVIFEFIVVAYSFHFFIELAIVPILAIITLLWGFTEKKPDHANVHDVLLWIMALFALVTIIWSISGISSDPAGFF